MLSPGSYATYRLPEGIGKDLSIAPAENKARGGEEGCWTGDKLGKGGESALPEVLFSCFSLLLLVTLHTQQSNYKFIN